MLRCWRRTTSLTRLTSFNRHSVSRLRANYQYGSVVSQRRFISSDRKIEDLKSEWKSKNLMVLYETPPECLNEKLSRPDERYGAISLSRLLMPVDANPAGNVHGGTILALIEQAGAIAASKHMHVDGHCATASPALIRMGHVDFVAPAFVGDVGMGQAKVVFTSKRSVLVLVHVWSENPRSGEVRLCNRAFAWYVPLKLTGDAIFEVPQLKVDPTDSLATCLWEYAHSSYTKRRVNGNPSRGSYLAPNHPLVSKIPLDGEEKTNDDGHDFIFPLLPMKCPPGNEAAPDYRTVEETEANLAALVLPSDMLTGDFAAGGMIMKMIDNCAGIVAFKHCRSNVVTASLDALDFMRPIKSGNLVTLRGKATYASPKSLEILVTVEVEDLMAGTRQPANQAILTFVKLDAAGKVQPMPGLIINTRKQHERMRIGHERYEIRKRIRSAQPIARP